MDVVLLRACFNDFRWWPSRTLVQLLGDLQVQGYLPKILPDGFHERLRKTVQNLETRGIVTRNEDNSYSWALSFRARFDPRPYCI